MEEREPGTREEERKAKRGRNWKKEEGEGLRNGRRKGSSEKRIYQCTVVRREKVGRDGGKRVGRKKGWWE